MHMRRGGRTGKTELKSGSKEWIIENCKSMFTTTYGNKPYDTSKPFEMADLTWDIRVYPNGKYITSKGEFMIELSKSNPKRLSLYLGSL